MSEGHEPTVAYHSDHECVIACECGVESHGRTWEDAGRERDEHIRRETMAVSKDGGR